VLAGNPGQMAAIRRVSSPYNVNAVALACLPEAIADQSFIDTYVNQVLDSRLRLESALRGAGIQFWPSQGNFVLARVGSSQADSAAFVEQMRLRGILVRDRSADHNCKGCVRITVGLAEHTDRLLNALRETVAALDIRQGVPR